MFARMLRLGLLKFVALIAVRANDIFHSDHYHSPTPMHGVLARRIDWQPETG